MVRNNVNGKSFSEIAAKSADFCRSNGYSGHRYYILLASGQGIALKEFFSNPRKWYHTILTLRQGWPHLLNLPIYGAKTYVDTNMRIFYPEQNKLVKNAGFSLTAKIALDSGIRRGDLLYEIKARKLFSKNFRPHSPIPEITSYDKKKFLWFEEKYIFAKSNVAPKEKVDRFLQDYAEQLYRPFIRHRPLELLLKRKKVSFDQLKSVFNEAGADIDMAHLSRTLPFAFVHGDLFAANIIIDRDDNLHVIDWETMHAGPIAWDFLYIYNHHQDFVLDVLDKLSTDYDISARMQLQLAAALRLIQKRGEIESDFLYRKKQRRKSEEKELKEIHQKIENLLLLIKNLELQ